MTPLTGLVLITVAFCLGCLTGDAAASRRFRGRLARHRRAIRNLNRLFWRVYHRWEHAASEGEALRIQLAGLERDNLEAYGRLADAGLELAALKASLVRGRAA